MQQEEQLKSHLGVIANEMNLFFTKCFKKNRSQSFTGFRKFDLSAIKKQETIEQLYVKMGRSVDQCQKIFQHKNSTNIFEEKKFNKQRQKCIYYLDLINKKGSFINANISNEDFSNHIQFLLKQFNMLESILKNYTKNIDFEEKKLKKQNSMDISKTTLNPITSRRSSQNDSKKRDETDTLRDNSQSLSKTNILLKSSRNLVSQNMFENQSALGESPSGQNPQKRQIRFLQTQNENLSQENLKKAKMINILKQKIKKLEQNLVDSSKKLQQINDKNKQEQRMSIQKIDDMKQLLERYEMRIDRRKQELQSLEDKIIESQDKIHFLKLDRQQLQYFLQGLNLQITIKSKNIQSLSNQSSTIQKNKQKTLSPQCINLQKQLIKKQEKIKILTQEIINKSSSLEKLSEDNQSFKALIEHYQNTFSTFSLQFKSKNYLLEKK